jgi:hypothetical protein
MQCEDTPPCQHYRDWPRQRGKSVNAEVVLLSHIFASLRHLFSRMHWGPHQHLVGWLNVTALMVLSVTSADTSHTAIVAQTNSAAATEQYLLAAVNDMLNTATSVFVGCMCVQSRGASAPMRTCMTHLAAVNVGTLVLHHTCRTTL